MNGIAELYRLRLAETIAAGDTTPMMVFPIGEWHSALYPDLPLTEDLANELIANFESGILGTEPVVDSSGKHDTSVPAAGWVKRVYLASYEEDDVTGLALWADVKWTGIGATMLSDDQYKYGSVEIGPVVTNEKGDKVDNVLRSLTLTNTPVLRIMPGVKNAAEKQRVAVTLSLSEVTLAAIPEFIKAKMRAKWLKANPGKTEDDVPENMQASLAEAGSTNDEREALESAVQDTFGATQEGLYVEDFGPDWVVFHTWQSGEGTYYRASYAKTESGTTLGTPVEVKRETTYVPVDSSPTGAQPASSAALSHDAKANEGHGAHLAEGDAARKGVDHHMDPKTLSILKLSEGADDVAIDAAVSHLSEERDAAVTELAESKKKAELDGVTVKLDEKIAGAFIAPGEREAYVKLAETDAKSAEAMIEARTSKVLDLTEHGTGIQGDDKPTKRADVELSELTQARMVKDGCDYVTAMNLTLSENPNDIKTRYEEFRAGKEG